jgi:hypothetical protein
MKRTALALALVSFACGQMAPAPITDLALAPSPIIDMATPPTVDILSACECLRDIDCREPMLPRCDPTNCSCVACLPTRDNCVNGHCDPATHQCVCLVDGECPFGRICQNLTCVPASCNDATGCPYTLWCCHGFCTDTRSDWTNCGGCGIVCPPEAGRCCDSHCVDAPYPCFDCITAHDCPNAEACCNEMCTNTTSDVANCGGCGMVCQGGWNCCNSICSNPANDVVNCGGCGNNCFVNNGVPKCVARACAIAACKPGWADCNNNYLDGCETNINTNVNSCGTCANACLAGKTCVNGVCE